MTHQAAFMRTTVTLEPDLAKKVKDLAHRRGVSFKQALNEVIRLGLAAPAQRTGRKRFEFEPHASGFVPGIDPNRLNQLNDQLQDEELLAKLRR